MRVGTRREFVERRSIDYVPIAERRGKVWHLWPVWFAGGAHLATVATGVVGPALGGSLGWMAVAVVLGTAFGTFFMAFHATQGPQLGLPQMIQSRPQFGHRGALLVWAVALIAYVGFNAFNQILAAQTLATVFAAPATITMLPFALLAAALAIAGYDLIHVTQRGVAYATIAGFLLFSGAVLAHPPWRGGAAVFGPFLPVPFLAQCFAAASYQLAWSIYVSDYSRYLPPNVGVGASFWFTYVGAFLGGAWTMLIGTLTAALHPTLDVAAALRATADTVLPHSGVPLLLCAMLGLVTITSLNAYGASLTTLSIADSFRPLRPTFAKRAATLLAWTLVSTLVALASSKRFIDAFGEFLSLLLYLLTPWTAINLVDFYLVRRGHYSVREIFNPRGMYGRWSWRGILAYAAGFVAMIPFFSTESYKGYVARALGGADLAMLVGLPVAAIVYLAACRSLDLERERALARAADVDLDPDQP